MGRRSKFGLAKENVGARLPIDWVAEMRNIADRRRVTMSDLMNEAIAGYLGKTLSKEKATLEQLEMRVAALEARLGEGEN